MDSSQTVQFEWTTRINLMVDELCRSAWSAQPDQPMVFWSGIHVVRQETSGGSCQRPGLISTDCRGFFRSLASTSARRSFPPWTAAAWFAPANWSSPGAASVRPVPAPSRFSRPAAAGRWQERSGHCLSAGAMATVIPHGNGENHKPRHGRVHRNFAPEFGRLRDERIAAFREFRADVDTGGHPEAAHTVPIKDDEFDGVLAKVQG